MVISCLCHQFNWMWLSPQTRASQTLKCIPAGGNAGSGSGKPPVMFCQPINMEAGFYMCFCLNTPWIIQSWFINTDFAAGRTIAHAWMERIPHAYFFRKGHPSLLALRNTSQCFSSTPEAVLNAEIPSKNHSGKQKDESLQLSSVSVSALNVK